jgi:hypothetical protein
LDGDDADGLLLGQDGHSQPGGRQLPDLVYADFLQRSANVSLDQQGLVHL